MVEQFVSGGQAGADLVALDGRPCLQVFARGAGYLDPALAVQRFVAEHRVRVLNVARSRESREPGIWRVVYDTLERAFFDGGAGAIFWPGEG